MKGMNIMHDTIFLHTTAVAEEVHFVHLPLILHFQLLLSGKSSLQLLLLGKQARLQLLCLFLLGRETGLEFIHLPL